MDSLFDTWLAKLAAIGAVLIGVCLAWQWQRAAAPADAPSANVARAWDGPIGPGLASAVPPVASMPAGLETDPAGHLVAGPALCTLLDSFLADDAQRAARTGELRAFLRTHLRAPALDEAERIAASYLAYLDAEQRYLARERFTAPAADGLAERDVEHLLAWQEQRAQQRERMLGTALAQAWFGASDARCAAMLRDWQVQHLALPPGEELDQAELRERRIRGAVLAQRRDDDALGCARQLTGAHGGV